MGIVNFTPDPTQPFGTGTFTNDQGRTWYSFDPDAAREAVTPAPVNDMAGGGSTPDAGAAPDASAPGEQSMVQHTPESLVSAVAQPVPPPATQTPAPSSVIHTPQSATAASASVVPPVSETSHTTQTTQGRPLANVKADLASANTAEQGAESAVTSKAQGDEQRLAASSKAAADFQTQRAEDQQQYAQDAANRRAALQKQLDAATAGVDPNIDPDRFIKTLSTGSAIAMTILAGIAGGGAALQGSNKNVVLDMLDERIKQDIESQKEQIASGRIRRGNIVANLRDQLGDEKQAELAANQKMWEASANKAEILTRQLGLQGAQLDGAKVQIAGMQQNAANYRNQLLATAESRTSTSDTTQRKPPANQSAQILELQSKALDNYKKAVDGGTNPDAAFAQSGMGMLGMAKPTGSTKEDKQQAIEAGKRTDEQGKAQGVLDASDRLAKAEGLVRDKDGGLTTGGTVAPNTERMSALAAYHAAAKAAGLDPGVPTSELGEAMMGRGDLAATLNSNETVLRPRLNQQDRSASKAIPQSWK